MYQRLILVGKSNVLISGVEGLGLQVQRLMPIPATYAHSKLDGTAQQQNILSETRDSHETLKLSTPETKMYVELDVADFEVLVQCIRICSGVNISRWLFCCRRWNKGR